jgi:hypothetical protein
MKQPCSCDCVLALGYVVETCGERDQGGNIRGMSVEVTNLPLPKPFETRQQLTTRAGYRNKTRGQDKSEEMELVVVAIAVTLYVTIQ